MHYEEIRQLTQQQPFEPFRIRLSNGETYDITHPEMLMIGRLALHIGVPGNDLPMGVFDKMRIVSMLHVAEVFPLSILQPHRNGADG